MKQLIVSREARQDHREAAAFYDERSGGEATGDRFTQAVSQAFDLIAEAPQRHGFSPHGSRRLIMEDFPHEIHFVETGKVIQVIAVWDHHRNPHGLRRRLKPFQ